MLKINPSKRSDFFKFFIAKKYDIKFEFSNSESSEIDLFYEKLPKSQTINLLKRFKLCSNYKETLEMTQIINNELMNLKIYNDKKLHNKDEKDDNNKEPLNLDLIVAFLYTNTIFANLCKKESTFEHLRNLFLSKLEKIKPEISEFSSIKSKKSENPNLPKPRPSVITRFPPEPSGYLHIGHAKAALLNQYYGTKILRVRFDDTNQNKEYEKYEPIILEDLKLLKIDNYVLTRTSDYFDQITDFARKMIQIGKAYCDNTPVDVMRDERDKGIESKNRNLSAEENLKIFDQIVNLRKKRDDLKDGDKDFGKSYSNNESINDKIANRGIINESTSNNLLKYCVRAKIDFQNVNKALRDPVIMRINLTPHHRTKNRFILYPTYDFACPIVDYLEQVDMVLRTNEFHDRNDQYFWFLETLNFTKPQIFDFSRLNFKNTILSKRKLRYFVENNMVSGWDDPRLPTIRGLIRLGLNVEALKEYVILQGANQKVSVATVDKLWAINKKFIDDKSPRFSIVEEDFIKIRFVSDRNEHVSDEKISDEKKIDDKNILKDNSLINKINNLNLNSYPEELTVSLHKKNSKLGTKKIFTTDIIISRSDANQISENMTFTLLNLGNVDVLKITNSEIVVKKSNSLDFKDTAKISWISKKNSRFIKIIEYSELCNGNEIEDFNVDSKKEKFYLAESSLVDKKGCVVQFERFGFCYCDDVGVYHLIPYTKQKRN
ncbi:putative glutamate--tRNA ligase, cytoplasmic [Dictyocoela muelleri]|nr:putative glutamate--tRNA ligase, cytoplasmic [Dictyocoela muelleri]